ncbi:glycosyltransferase family 2 protein [Sphingomonas sp. MMS24-J13]|uniref:glycosyltransferase family 2 protein n=1 Tax=Sphingomonas sp. MMS24-J13 TaxID=3238686 RepID=UPI00384BDC50
MPTVSILIPTYNGARHIEAAIASVLSQQGVDFEIIVADDHSRDNTADIVAAVADPRIRLVRNAANLGAEANWNAALALATGTYVKLLPQDDLILPGALARQVAVLEADRDSAIALAFSARIILDTHGKRLMTRGYGPNASGRIPAATLARACVRRGTNVIGEPGAVLFRRALAERIGGFDARQPYVVDLDYWLRLLAHGDAWYSADPVSAFRVSSGSWSVRIGASQARQYGAFLDRMGRAGLVPTTRRDVAIGKLNALASNLARLIFYKVVAR